MTGRGRFHRSVRPAAVASRDGAPGRAGPVLVSLIVAAFVCNVNLAVANVALPDIGSALDASQTQITLIAVGCTLGLAMSVLYLGAVGDRYGRKLLLVLGLAVTVVTAPLCAWAPTATVLVVGRVLTGLAAGMAYPTTLALITALWAPGPARVRAIALWSGVGGAAMVLGPTVAGALLERYWWGSVFLVVVPVAVSALALVVLVVPAHAQESAEPVDHPGGVLSVAMIATVVLGISLVATPGKFGVALGLLFAGLVAVGVFVGRERRVAAPLYDLHVAARRMFWVPAVAGMIVFGSLSGAMFVGQQFLQNVLGYTTFHAGLAVVPAAVGLVMAAPVSARAVVALGSRITMLAGFGLVLPAFVVMLCTWKPGAPFAWVGLAYLLIGLGAGLALTPASQALTGSVPVHRVGMASGTTDLQRDLGGSIMQALLGALLTAGYTASVAAQLGSQPDAAEITAATRAALLQSYSSAAALARSDPGAGAAIVAGARSAFLQGSDWAFVVALVAGVIGTLLVVIGLPGKVAEGELVAGYARADGDPGVAAPDSSASASVATSSS